MVTPRLRQDLKVTPAQEAGVLYFDVRDPRTGAVLRLYDIEWWVAERFDGVSTYDDLSRWAEGALGYAPTRGDLEIYAQRLQQLGLFDVISMSPGAGEARAAARAYEGPATSGGGPGLQVIGHPHPSSSLTPVVNGALSQLSQALSEPDPEPVVPSVPVGGVPMSIPRDRERPSLRLSTVQAPKSDDVMGAPLQPASEGPSAPPRSVAQKQAAAEPEVRSTLMMPTTVESINESVPRVELPPTSAAPIAPQEAPPSPSSSLPGAEAVPVVLTAPERSTPLMAPPLDLPVESGEGPLPPKPETRVETRPEQKPEARPETKVEAKPEQKPELKTDAKPETKVEASPDAGPKASSTDTPAYAAGEPSPKPPLKSDLATVKTNAATPAKAAEPEPDRGEEVDEAPTGGAGRWIALVIVLAALAVALYFVFQMRGTSRTPVSVLRAQPHEVLRTSESTARVQVGAGQVLRMEAGGLLASVVSEGAEVTAGMSLAVLQTHGKLQKEITELRDRLAYYQKKVDNAKERGGSGDEYQAKVNEKQERLAHAEDNLKKAELLAPRSGKVQKVLVKAGELVTPGSEILELSERGLSAELRAPATEKLTVGQELRLRGAETAISAKVASVKPAGDGQVVATLELGDAAGLKAGDELRLVKGQLPGVVELPDAAIVSGNAVFVVEQGRAKRRPVEVVDHEGNQALVRGLGVGDSVIVGGAADLRDGQPVQVAP